MSLAKYLVIAGVVVVAGVGYHFYTSRNANTPVATNNPPMATSTMAMPSSTGFLPPTVDATWQTYRNSTLKFFLNFPTKGIYAPKFTVKVIKATDTHLKDGCYDDIGGGTIERVNLGGVDFCRVIHAPSTTVALDTEYWSTKKDSQVAVITFTKKYSSSTTGFDVNAYRQFVGGLMSTFQYPTSTQP